MTIDYDAEYNNTARVKNAPEILTRLVTDATAYREQATSEARAELGCAYGSSPRQFVDIFHAARRDDAPLAMFIHGGYWRILQPQAFSSLARGLNAHGVTVALAGYDLCPNVGIGDIVAQMQQACLFLWQRFRKRILVHGHSAGGHLTAAMLSTDWQKYGAPQDMVASAMAISGLFDLAPLVATKMNADFRLDDAEARRQSPLFWPAPAGRTLDAVVGGDESSEFLRQSRIIVDQWGSAGVTVRFEAITGANHFSVIEPLADPGSPMVRRLLTLLPRG
jgi:arylformamidase